MNMYSEIVRECFNVKSIRYVDFSVETWMEFSLEKFHGKWRKNTDYEMTFCNLIKKDFFDLRTESYQK